MSTMTEVARTAAETSEEFTSLSVPTYRGSTLIYPSYEAFVKRGRQGRQAYTYGLYGTPTSRTLAAKLASLEGGTETFIVPSGLMAITTTILSVVAQGDTVLLPDTVYTPVRRFAKTTLSKFGVAAAFYDPADIGSIDFSLPNLRLIWVESPGSITMEVQDIPAIAAHARDHGILVACDNSWASPILCKPLALGADIVVEAVTKYLSGHSDVLMGSITVKDDAVAADIYDTIRSIGVGVSPDDCFLAIRGLESAAVRLAHIERSALRLAQDVGASDRVSEVFHPALPGFPTHHLWKKQFSGSSGVFSFVMRDEPEENHADRYGRLRLFKIGASWGGTHSLLAPSPLEQTRTVNCTHVGKRVIRLSTGLEASEDLIDDMGRFLS